MPLLTPQSLQKAAPVVLGAMLFSLGLYALYHLLKPVDPADVVAQIRATPVSALAAALAATAIGYVSLIFYDWFGLRFIGRSLDRGVVALGGFLGYAFGNTIGVSVVSGGAVRYRVYSAVGLVRRQGFSERAGAFITEALVRFLVQLRRRRSGAASGAAGWSPS